MKDFYFRDIEDPDFVEDILEVADERELAIMQIKMTLLTNKGEVFGMSTFGCSLDNYMYEFEYDPKNLMAFLTQQIKTFSEVARGFDVELNLKRVPDGRFRDAGIIDVKLGGKSYFGMVI